VNAIRLGNGFAAAQMSKRGSGESDSAKQHGLSVTWQSAPGRSRRITWLQRVKELGNGLVPSLPSWRERRYATRISQELLSLYRIVAARHAGLPRREIYRKVVMARTGDPDEARTILSWAKQSFASWPSERELTFIDVVHYLAVSEYLATSGRISTRVNMGRLIAGLIPEDL
jgi:hypothetical protein